MSDPQVGSVPFDEAIGFLRDKVRLPTRRWTDLWEGQHARAFVVAGAVQDDVLADFQTSLMRSIEAGQTKEQWRDEFDRIAQSWTGDWKGRSTERGRAWRSSVIWDTNCRMAYAAGQWQQIQQVKADRPFLLYSAVMDARTRPDHARWNGTILPVDHPWWHSHYPPNGWYCRCQVIQLSQRDLDRRGWRVSEPPVIETRPWRNPATGEVIQVPVGIDPGFGDNVGRAGFGAQLADDTMEAWRRQGADAWEVLNRGGWETAGRPRQVPADRPRARPGEAVDDVAAMTSAIERVIGGPENSYRAPDGTGVSVVAASLAAHLPRDRAPWVPFISEAIEDPYEIWVTWERHRGTGKVVLRKRMLKVIDLPRGQNQLVLVAQAVGGRIEAWTMIPSSRAAALQRWRIGTLAYGR